MPNSDHLFPEQPQVGSGVDGKQHHYNRRYRHGQRPHGEKAYGEQMDYPCGYSDRRWTAALDRKPGTEDFRGATNMNHDRSASGLKTTDGSKAEGDDQFPNYHPSRQQQGRQQQGGFRSRYPRGPKYRGSKLKDPYQNATDLIVMADPYQQGPPRERRTEEGRGGLSSSSSSNAPTTTTAITPAVTQGVDVTQNVADYTVYGAPARLIGEYGVPQNGGVTAGSMASNSSPMPSGALPSGAVVTGGLPSGTLSSSMVPSGMVPSSMGPSGIVGTVSAGEDYFSAYLNDATPTPNGTSRQRLLLGTLARLLSREGVATDPHLSSALIQLSKKRRNSAYSSDAGGDWPGVGHAGPTVALPVQALLKHPALPRLTASELQKLLADLVKDELIEMSANGQAVLPLMQTKRRTVIIRDPQDQDSVYQEFVLKSCPHITQQSDILGVYSVVNPFSSAVFLTFRTEELAQKVALWLNGRNFNGQTLRVAIKNESQYSLCQLMPSTNATQSVTQGAALGVAQGVSHGTFVTSNPAAQVIANSIAPQITGLPTHGYLPYSNHYHKGTGSTSSVGSQFGNSQFANGQYGSCITTLQFGSAVVPQHFGSNMGAGNLAPYGSNVAQYGGDLPRGGNNASGQYATRTARQYRNGPFVGNMRLYGEGAGNDYGMYGLDDPAEFPPLDGGMRH